ncbi:MAG: 7,8-didemethyl-8-hydroxy-5-deazariboflavin synthase subunit CofH [Thermoprotei archaeon]|nr:MAG: 7,8-didemethyl-8-hydroxy-5-deazariboflavin synthase subunit CofH [Thermoprotei archaeon]
MPINDQLPSLLDKALKELDPLFSQAIDKAVSGRDISEEELVRLLEADSTETLILALAADYVRKLSVGDTVTFVVNRNINFTNECVIRCLFCAYSRPLGHSEGYTLSVEEVVERACEAWRAGATEVCIQGAINPKLPVDYYFEVLRGIKSKVPDIHIHAFSPQEVYSIARRMDVSYREVLKALREAGLDSMPGTAAEILDDEVRMIIAPNKIGVRDWIEIIKEAHKLGVPTTATMMYGHVDSSAHRARHMRIIRDIQAETKGFTEFVLLPYIYLKTELYRRGLARPGTSWIEDLKVHAAARLFLNNYIRNLQASWVKLGPKMAQLMLSAGANDLGGTLMEENISSAAGARYGTSMSVEEMVNLIKSIGRKAAQRSTTYEILRVFG